MNKKLTTLYQSSIILLVVSLLILLLSQWHLSGEPYLSFNQEIQDSWVNSINKESEITKLKKIALELVEEKSVSNNDYEEAINIIRFYSLFITICLVPIIFRIHKVRKEISNN